MTRKSETGTDILDKLPPREMREVAKIRLFELLT
jgi:hypothetical protein